MKLKKIKFFNLLVFLIIGFYSCYSCGLSTAYSNNNSIIEEYLKIFQEYNTEMCTPDLEKKYTELLKDFRGEGYYVPVLSEGDDTKIDVNALRLRLPLVQQKINWLDKLIEQLNKKEKLPTMDSLTKGIELRVDKLLKIKKLYFHDKNHKHKKKYLIRSKKAFLGLRKEFNAMIKKIPFLLSFNFPVDYFGMRKEYDHYKQQRNPALKKKAGSVFLKRKILEDGAYELDNTKPDISLRANLDTLYLRLKQNHVFLPEDIRYDLEDTFKLLEKFISLSKNNHLERLIAWKIRAENEYNFYFKLLQDAQGSKAQQDQTTFMLSKRSVAKHLLKDFVLKNEAKAYKFWISRPEIFSALFTLETILINEVGSLDGYGNLERKDVAQVVVNRHNLSSYSSLRKHDSILSYLQDINPEKIQKNAWANLLFKEGEFSFTYFYIPASKRIFCPDLSRNARNLQLENLKIALEILSKPNYEFKATRYFSRASMPGRIDMSPMWSDHQSLPERAGIQIQESGKLFAAINKGNYKYFYTFEDQKEQNFDVVEISGKTVVMSSHTKNRNFYHYRNPHYFRYFEKKGEKIPEIPLFESLAKESSP